MDIQESRLAIFKRDKFKCHCGNNITRFGTPQLGHRIKQTKYNIKKFGKDVIHHKLNLVSCCSLICNSKVDLGVRGERINALVKKILEVKKND